MYSTAGEETSGLESSFTSPSVHKDMIEQYLNKMGTSSGGTAGLGISGDSTMDQIANLYHTNSASMAGLSNSAGNAAAAAALAAAVQAGSSGLGTTSNYRPSALTGTGQPLSSLSALPSASTFGLANLPITSSATSNLLLDDFVDGKTTLSFLIIVYSKIYSLKGFTASIIFL